MGRTVQRAGRERPDERAAAAWLLGPWLALALPLATTGCPSGTLADDDAADDDAGDDDTGDDDTGDDDTGDDDTTPCPPFADRLRVTAVDVSPRTVAVGSASGFSDNRPVLLAERPSGGAMVAWSDGAEVLLTPLDADDGRAGPDQPVDGSEVRGFVAHDDGAAVLVRRGDRMVLVRVDDGGGVVWEHSFVGGNDHGSEGDAWIDDWDHEGRLAWSGAEYAVYFGHTRNWGAQGNHQGDLLAFFDDAGAVRPGGWSWGCSHSLEVRLAYSGDVPGPVCLSDCYPDKGLFYDHNTLVFADPSGDCWGHSDAELGGLVPAGGGFWFTFASAEGRASHDVALVSIGAAGDVAPPRWLTDTAGTHERAPYLARYGDDLLAAWHADGALWATVIDGAGGEIEPPTVLQAWIAERDDLVSRASGAVGWAAAWETMSELRVVRLGWCE